VTSLEQAARALDATSDIGDIVTIRNNHVLQAYFALAIGEGQSFWASYRAALRRAHATLIEQGQTP
jgi:hypothetical protein